MAISNFLKAHFTTLSNGKCSLFRFERQFSVEKFFLSRDENDETRSTAWFTKKEFTDINSASLDFLEKKNKHFFFSKKKH